MPNFRPVPEITREIADLRIARAAGTAPFGSAARLVALEEEREAAAAIACPQCGGTGVYSGPASLNRRGREARQVAFGDRLTCRRCRGRRVRSGVDLG